MFVDEQTIAKKFNQISLYLNERTLRIWAATEALSLPRGGISLLTKITGLSRTTIYVGISELKQKKSSIGNHFNKIFETGNTLHIHDPISYFSNILLALTNIQTKQIFKVH